MIGTLWAPVEELPFDENDAVSEELVEEHTPWFALQDSPVLDFVAEPGKATPAVRPKTCGNPTEAPIDIMHLLAIGADAA
ncbi:MAG: hypothetical protein IMZ66_04870 [Planctomycetes bacterium]|nr:hypothetical protein [Planctomycetota bacterium]